MQNIQISTLQAQLAKLQREGSEEKAAALQQQQQMAISAEIGGREVRAAGSLRSLITAKYGDKLQQQGGAWVVEDADDTKPLSEVVSSFLDSEDGQIFTPAPAPPAQNMAALLTAALQKPRR